MLDECALQKSAFVTCLLELVSSTVIDLAGFKRMEKRSLLPCVLAQIRLVLCTVLVHVLTQLFLFATGMHIHNMHGVCLVPELLRGLGDLGGHVPRKF